MAIAVLDVDNIERPGMPFNVDEDSDPTGVRSSGDGNERAGLQLGPLQNFVRFNVQQDGVTNTDVGVGESERASVVGGDVGGAVWRIPSALDAADLDADFISLNFVEDEFTLGVVQQTVFVAGLLNSDDIHETSGEFGVGADAAINFDESLSGDVVDFFVRQSVLQTVPNDQAQGDGFE